MRNFRQSIYKIFNTRDNKKIAFVFRYIIAFLILVNVALQIVAFSTTNASYLNFVKHAETGFLIFFSIEYVFRVFTGSLRYPHLNTFKGTIKYIFSFYGLVDLLAIVPSYFGFNATALRILRLFKFLPGKTRGLYTNSFVDVKTVFKTKSKVLVTSFFVLLMLILTAAVLMYTIEHDAQPHVFSNILDSLWWAVVTFTTIGYGDIVPITIMGKLLGGLIALMGVCIVAIPTGVIVAGFNELNAKKLREQEIKEAKLDETKLTLAEQKEVENFVEYLKSKRK